MLHNTHKILHSATRNLHNAESLYQNQMCFPEKRPSQSTWSFFNEIRLTASEISLRDVKYASRVKYLLRKCDGEFYFTFCVSRKFHNPSGLFHIFATQKYFIKKLKQTRQIDFIAQY